MAIRTRREIADLVIAAVSEYLTENDRGPLDLFTVADLEITLEERSHQYSATDPILVALTRQVGRREALDELVPETKIDVTNEQLQTASLAAIETHLRVMLDYFAVMTDTNNPPERDEMQ